MSVVVQDIQWIGNTHHSCSMCTFSLIPSTQLHKVKNWRKYFLFPFTLHELCSVQFQQSQKSGFCLSYLGIFKVMHTQPLHTHCLSLVIFAMHTWFFTFFCLTYASLEALSISINISMAIPPVPPALFDTPTRTIAIQVQDTQNHTGGLWPVKINKFLSLL